MTTGQPARRPASEAERPPFEEASGYATDRAYPPLGYAGLREPPVAGKTVGRVGEAVPVQTGSGLFDLTEDRADLHAFDAGQRSEALDGEPEQLVESTALHDGLEVVRKRHRRERLAGRQRPLAGPLPLGGTSR